MSVRLKVLLVVVTVFAALLTIFSFYYYHAQTREFSAMEARETIARINNVAAIVGQELGQLQGTTADWASWDETYQFAQDGNAGYVEGNGSKETFINNRVSLMVVADGRGRILFGRGYDPAHDVSYPLQAGVTRDLESLLRRWTGTEKKGFLRLGEEGMVMAVARPILTSKGEGPPRGIFLFARRLDEAKIRSWGEIAQVKLRASRWDESDVPEDVRAVRAELGSRGEAMIRILSDDLVGGYQLLRDFEQRPAIVLSVSLPRDLYRQGVHGIHSFILSILAVGVAFSLVIMVLLNRVVLLPLGELSRFVGSVKADNLPTASVISSGRDEFRQLDDGIARMLSDLKRYQQNLKKSELKYRSLFEESQDCIFIVAADGRVLDMNPAGIGLFGYDSLPDMKAVNFARQLCADQRQFEMAMDRLRQSGAVKDFEMQLVDRQGKAIIGLLTAGAVKDDEGGVSAARGILRDVTEQRHLRQQLLHAQKMEALGTMAGGIAHDFNNLLTGILAYSTMMLGKMEKDHPMIEYVTSIEKSATRAAELTDQLLAFARKGKYDVRVIDFNEVVREVCQLIVHTFDRAIEINTHLLPGLPKVEGDRTRLLQAVMNLCVNARDAMPKGGLLTLTTERFAAGSDFIARVPYAREGDYVLLTVRDTGAGMDEETAKKIFEPFFTTKAEGRGTGLGLAMVYGTVKGHGGFIDVKSAPGAGSTFRIYLPVVTRELPPDPEVKQIAAVPDRSAATILVVDDDPTIRSVVKIVLESDGYGVLLAAGGEEALALYGANLGKVDLVIIDMLMPHMGGQETFTRLKEVDPQVRAVLSTGYSDEVKVQEIMSSGIIGFVKKPFRAKDLSAKVAEALGKGLNQG